MECADFLLQRADEADTGPYVYVLKVMSVFVSMHRIMGKHFETGLEKLKRVAER